jgi:protein gp37
MANATAIEWTDATWNPVTGCTKISAGCDHCYAERFSERFRGTRGHPFENGFDLTLRPERLEQPLRWREPRMIFVNSMSDLFHKEIPNEFIARLCDTMERAHWHTFQVLTKRSSLMRDFLRRRAVSHVVRRFGGRRQQEEPHTAPSGDSCRCTLSFNRAANRTHWKARSYRH